MFICIDNHFLNLPHSLPIIHRCIQVAHPYFVQAFLLRTQFHLHFSLPILPVQLPQCLTISFLHSPANCRPSLLTHFLFLLHHSPLVIPPRYLLSPPRSPLLTLRLFHMHILHQYPRDTLSTRRSPTVSARSCCRYLQQGRRLLYLLFRHGRVSSLLIWVYLLVCF